jgi:hypothetical protein
LGVWHLLSGSGKIAALRDASNAWVSTKLLFQFIDFAAEARELALHQLAFDPETLPIFG